MVTGCICLIAMFPLSGKTVAQELTEKDGWESKFVSRNYARFLVNTENKSFIEGLEDYDCLDGWGVSQKPIRYNLVEVKISYSEYDRIMENNE